MSPSRKRQSNAAGRRIERAASSFVASHRTLQDKLWRFEIIACTSRAWPKHIEDALRPR
jgi:Holliday junction resolvase-like predicted endonuclease